MYVNVLVPIPLPTLTYKVPDNICVKIGDPVFISLKKKRALGFVAQLLPDFKKEESKYEIKEILELSQDHPRLSEKLIALLLWTAEYYHYPAGEVFRSFLPNKLETPTVEEFALTKQALEAAEKDFTEVKGKKQVELLRSIQSEGGKISSPSSNIRPILRSLMEKRLVEKKMVQSFGTPSLHKTQTSTAPNLTMEQAQALHEITESIERNIFTPFLLEGVTGSGKTEVYLGAVEKTLERGRSALVVVPEIALTPQLVSRFENRFQMPLAVIHSAISEGEFTRQWHLLNNGNVKICIGARSAVLAPIRDLGLIIVDEEHESALKQEDHLRYHGRDLAIMRAKYSHCPIVLGSATPSLESFYNAKKNRFRHLHLPYRATGIQLPEVEIVNQSSEKDKLISTTLKRRINEALGKKQQTMLLLNRRGFASFQLCKDCGHVPGCPNCSVSLTHYMASRQLLCHYCGYKESPQKKCSKCQSEAIGDGTEGTEALEQEAINTFPGATILRIDRESVSKKGSLEKALDSIASGAIDIVIGTQIIAKGHDFPNVSLVGVIHADSSFNLPDFRAAEKSFQLFTQMAGRAGRGEIHGKVIIQTFNPNHPSIAYAIEHNYRGFAEQELVIRQRFSYPPFCRLARILITSTDDREAERQAEKVFIFLEQKLRQYKNTELVGPAPAVLHKINSRYRWNILLKGNLAGEIHALLQQVCFTFPKKSNSQSQVHIDVDPTSLM